MKNSFDLRQKIFGGILLPAVLALIGFVAAIVFMGSSRQEIRDLRDREFEHSKTAWKLRLDVVQVQQWLTDISATRGLDGLDDGFSEAEKYAQDFLQDLDILRADL